MGFENVIKDDDGYYCLKYFTPLGSINDDIRVLQIENLDNEYVFKAAKSIADNLYKTQLFCQNIKNYLFLISFINLHKHLFYL